MLEVMRTQIFAVECRIAITSRGSKWWYKGRIIWGTTAWQLEMTFYRKIMVVIWVRAVTFATSVNLAVKSAIFPRRKIHKHTWTPPDGKKTRPIWSPLDRQKTTTKFTWYSIFRRDCDTDCRFRDGLSVSNRTAQPFDKRGVYFQKAKRCCSRSKSLTGLQLARHGWQCVHQRLVEVLKRV